MFKVFLDNKEITLYNSFSVKKSLWSFVDTFTISMWNPKWLYSKTIPIWAFFSLYVDDIEVFRWICENKSVTFWEVGSTLTFSGREELLLLTEDDISPLQKNYKDVTDNFIIQDVCNWYWWDFDLSEPKTIKEFDIPNNWIRKWQVIDDIINRNDLYIFKIWKTIYKRERPAESDYTERKKLQFTLATQWGWFIDYNNRLLDVSISEDISWIKSKLTWYTYGTWNEKPTIFKEINNTHLQDWSYPRRLRNIDSEQRVAPVINRQVSTSVPVKSKAELDLSMERLKLNQDIKISVNITIAEFLDLNILDTSEIFIQDEDIKQYMFIKEINYNYDSSNKFYTKFSYQPITPIENE